MNAKKIMRLKRRIVGIIIALFIFRTINVMAMQPSDLGNLQIDIGKESVSFEMPFLQIQREDDWRL